MRRRSDIEIRANMRVRDFCLILSLLGVGGNLLWCWQHQREIEQLKHPEQKIERINPMPPFDTPGHNPNPAATPNPTPVPVPETTDGQEPPTPGEQSADEIAAVAGGIIGQFAKNNQVVSEITGLSPVFIHLGFMLAHLFQHHAKTSAPNVAT